MKQSTFLRLTSGLVLLLLASAPTIWAGEMREIYRGEPTDAVAAIEIRGDELRVYRTGRPQGAVPERAVAPSAAMEAVSERGLALEANQRLVTSKDGSQSGRVTYALSEAGHLMASFELLREDGAAWRIESSGPTQFHISNDGSTVAAVRQDIHDSRGGRVTLYGAQGEELGSLDQPLIRSLDMAKDGSRVAVNTGRDGVLILDRGAQVLHRLPPAFDLRLSANGGTLAAFHQRDITVYQSGEEVARLTTGDTPRDAALAADGETLAAVDAGSLYSFAVGPGRTLFTREAQGRRLEYRAVDVAPDRRIVAGLLEVDQRRTRKKSGQATAHILLLGPDGSLLQSERFTPGSWNRSTPAIRLFAGGAKALVSSRDAVYVLDIGEPGS